MELVKAFLKKAQDDPRIGSIHISLFVALAVFSPSDGLLQLKKKELMKASRIRGKTAYYRCLRELAKYGYIEYWPEHYSGGSVVRVKGR